MEKQNQEMEQTMEKGKNNKLKKGVISSVLCASVIFGCGGLLAGCSGGTTGTMFTGTADPTIEMGQNGDMYFDTDDFKLYQKKDNAWVVSENGTNFGKFGIASVLQGYEYGEDDRLYIVLTVNYTNNTTETFKTLVEPRIDEMGIFSSIGRDGPVFLERIFAPVDADGNIDLREALKNNELYVMYEDETGKSLPFSDEDIKIDISEYKENNSDEILSNDMRPFNAIITYADERISISVEPMSMEDYESQEALTGLAVEKVELVYSMNDYSNLMSSMMGGPVTIFKQKDQVLDDILGNWSLRVHFDRGVCVNKPLTADMIEGFDNAVVGLQACKIKSTAAYGYQIAAGTKDYALDFFVDNYGAIAFSVGTLMGEGGRSYFAKDYGVSKTVNAMIQSYTTEGNAMMDLIQIDSSQIPTDFFSTTGRKSMTIQHKGVEATLIAEVYDRTVDNIYKMKMEGVTRVSLDRMTEGTQVEQEEALKALINSEIISENLTSKGIVSFEFYDEDYAEDTNAKESIMLTTSNTLVATSSYRVPEMAGKVIIDVTGVDLKTIGQFYVPVTYNGNTCKILVEVMPLDEDLVGDGIEVVLADDLSEYDGLYPDNNFTFYDGFMEVGTQTSDYVSFEYVNKAVDAPEIADVTDGLSVDIVVPAWGNMYMTVYMEEGVKKMKPMSVEGSGIFCDGYFFMGEEGVRATRITICGDKAIISFEVQPDNPGTPEVDSVYRDAFVFDYNATDKTVVWNMGEQTIVFELNESAGTFTSNIIDLVLSQ